MEDILQKTILVTGAGGQLGKELRHLASSYPDCEFLFKERELPIDNYEIVKKFFEQQQVDVCINCAAYTAVDKAESEKETAFLVNAEAVGNLAMICKQHQAQFIHISTDYVFDGTVKEPLSEDNSISPVNVYGASKLKGEELALKQDPSSIIIRTSWVYSSFGNNFLKTMLRLLSERPEISVVNDQYGCPTFAGDLAEVIMKIISSNEFPGGIINYSNEGITTWYEFALTIKAYVNSPCNIIPISTSEYPTPANRPAFSVLDTSKIKSILHLEIPNWKISLQKCLTSIQSGGK